ncbi:unnamed protein product [Ilex paraguariensis]|uniref:Uncharacterized protein n=1 Tax=Ilex paraguariensis TaxID=185542 RepID=A0ABC8V3W0_9AQUA
MSSPVDVDESVEISIFNTIDFRLHRLFTEEVSYGYQPPELEEEVCKIVGIKSHACFRGYGLPLSLFFGLGELYGISLHVAARRGRVGVMKEILDASPEEVELVNQRGENCLHIAVLYNQERAVRFLVDWLAKNRDYDHLIDGKDSDGKTPLHLAVSRKQIKERFFFFPQFPFILC